MRADRRFTSRQRNGLPRRETEDAIMVFEKVKDILVDQLDVDEDKVKADSSITDDLGADSLDVVDLVMSLEEEFDVEVPDEEVENMKTVGDIVKYIEDRI